MPRMTLNSTVLLIIGFVLLWNSGFIGAAFGLDYADPLTLLFWRYWVLAVLLGVWLAAVMFALQAGVPAGIVALVIALQPVTVGALEGLVTGKRA